MGYGGKDYGYTQSGYGYGTSEFVGFDGLAAVPDLLGWWSVSRRVLSRYSGPAIRLRRSSDSTEQDFYGIGPQGEVSTAAVRAFNGWNRFSHSENLAGATWAKPSGAVNHAIGTLGIESDVAASPSGAMTADRVNFVNQADADLGLNQVVTATGGATYTCSFMIKGEGSDVGKQIRLRMKRNTAGAFAGSNATITLTDSWVRHTLPLTLAADNVDIVCIFSSGIGGATAALLTELQLERASSFSTYEPRTTTAAGDSFLVTLYDQSGLARNFTQSTTTLQPIICEQGVPVTENGRLAAKFVAADARRMAIASSTAMFNALHTTGGTVLAVSRANDTAAIKAILNSNNGGSGAAGINFLRNASEAVFFQTTRLTGPATGSSVQETSVEVSAAQSILAITVDPDNVTAADRLFGWQNGAVLTGFANAETGTPGVENAANNLTLGAYAGGTNGFDGTISEVAAFSAAISDADRTAYQSRSGIFYGVTVS